MIGNGADDANGQVEREGDGGDVEADWVVVEVGERQPDQVISTPKTTLSARLAPMRVVMSCAVAGGATSSANTSSAPVICAVSATAIPNNSR